MVERSFEACAFGRSQCWVVAAEVRAMVHLANFVPVFAGGGGATRVEKKALMAREGGLRGMWMGCGVGLFLRSNQTLSVAEVGEGSESDVVEDSRGVGEPNGVEGSGCSGQSIDGGEVGCGLEDLAKYLWWEVYNGHRDYRSFLGCRYQVGHGDMGL